MPDYNHIWPFLVLLPLVAFLYASVGHGGASGYLALMALFGFSPLVMKPTALVLNIFVAGISFWHYWRQGHFKGALFWPFVLTSIPLAFVGGRLNVDPVLYKKILAVLLVFAILRLLNWLGREKDKVVPVKYWQGLLAGGAIGFFSGLIGIGGGIILTPLILLLHWGKMKEAAAVSALFIWVNSLAALAGQLSSGVRIPPAALGLILLAFGGGILGAWLGSSRLNNRGLRYLLALVLAIASGKLFFG